MLVWREQGLGELLTVAAEKSGVFRKGPRRVRLLVDLEDAAAVDWTTPPHFANPQPVHDTSVKTAWIMSVPGRSSGGHQNIFRFISFLEAAGHSATIYLYGERALTNFELNRVRQMVRDSSSYSSVQAPIEVYDRSRGVDPSTQAIFATGWDTAYPAYLDKSRAHRFYFVQDFEPSFYAVGSDHILAENTYRFGFHGITAGRWLTDKLASDYGMTADYFDFSADQSLYSVTNTGRRNEIFFYARPVTQRRAFEFGILALTDFHRMRPDVTINLAGWDVSTYKLPFDYVNHKDLEISELNDVYNRCAAGLVLSLTNMSLLPLELMSSGVVPVVNDGLNNSMVSDNPNIQYVPMSPKAIARELAAVVDREDAPEHASRIAASVGSSTWADSGKQFVQAFERVVRGA